MVRITVESEKRTDVFEGKSAIVCVAGLKGYGSEHAVMMSGQTKDPLGEIETAIVAVGSLIKQLIDNPFSQAMVANKMAKELVESMTNGRITVTENRSTPVTVHKESHDG